MVYELVSEVDTEQSIEEIKTETALYELIKFDIIIKNPYPTECEFQLSIKNEHKITSALNGTRFGDSRKPIMFPNGFGIEKTKISIRNKTKVTKLNLMILNK